MQSELFGYLVECQISLYARLGHCRRSYHCVLARVASQFNNNAQHTRPLDVHALVRELDLSRQAVAEESQEADRLCLCLSVEEAALTAAERETAAAEGVAAEAQATTTERILSNVSFIL